MKRGAKTANAIFIVVLLIAGLTSPTVTLTGTVNAQSQNEPSQVGSPFVPGRILVRFHPETPKSRGRGIIAQAGATDAGMIEAIGVHIVELPAGADEEAFIHAFGGQPEVEFAELDRVYAPEAMTPNDPSYPGQWHLPKIAGPTAWSTTTGSSGVTIAILDTGVDSTHPDLASKIVPGWNFYDNNSDTSDVYGHGTAVAGSAAAASNNGLGVAAVAWNCTLMPIRISALNGNASTSAMASGLTWAADHGARVANISYKVSTSSTVSSAARYFQSHGGVVAIAAGNDSTFYSTADNPDVITVSATTSSDALASWSNTGNHIDLASPGTSIYTTNRGGGYGSWSGTSFSSPIVAGVAALVISANPSLTASQIQDILKQSADDLGTAGWDAQYGWGRVNAARAVSLALGGGGEDLTPPTVSFNSPSSGANVSGTVTVQVAANDNVGIPSVSLSVDGQALGADTSAPYTFTWNTAALADGAHTLRAVAQDSAGNGADTSITVTVTNAADATSPTVTIISPVDGATVTGVNVSVVVNASDNRGVTKVELYVDGVMKASSTSSPFTTKWNIRKASAGPHALQCKAYDAAGNVGVSTVVMVRK